MTVLTIRFANHPAVLMDTKDCLLNRSLWLQACCYMLHVAGNDNVILMLSGGREEFEAIQDFASKLPPDTWLASETHFRNRQIAPVLFNIYKLPFQ